MKATPLTAAAMLARAERYLTIRDLCERLQCSRTTAWRLISERGLRAVRCGGLLRVRESDLLAWIEQHTQGSDSQGNGSEGT